ncbi:MAG: TetR/AcrR family transcriptional regulator [Acidimicrobiales bacterium]
MSLTPDTGIRYEPPEASLRARKKHRTRDRIYRAAVDLFAVRPYDEVTVDEICERAEVGRATFFRFYGSKAGLLGEFSHRLAERIAHRLDERPERSSTEQLWVVQDEIATAWGLSAPSTRSLAREWVRNATASDLKDPSSPELLALVADIVRDGQGSGEFTSDYEPDFVSWIILASFSSITAGWLDSEDDESLVRGTRDAVSLLLGGLRGSSRD